MIIGIEASHANKQKRTGVEEVCFQIIQELKNIIPSQTKVILYTHKRLNNELNELPRNWEVKVLPWPLSKGWSQIRLSFELFINRPDVFFAPGQLVPFLCPNKTITVVHDSAFRVFPKLYNKLARPYLDNMNKLIAKRSKKIITPSQFSRDEFLKFYNFQKENIRVIPWGYDKKRYTIEAIQQSDNILKKFNINKPYFISIGRIEKKKNTISIIKAFNHFRKNNKKEYQLLLIGEKRVGSEKIMDSINKSPYKDDIITPGWVDKEELPIILAKSSILIFPSKYEGFGLPVLQAMAVGVPVICSKNKALQEVGGEAAVYVKHDKAIEISEKMKELVNNKTKREKLIKDGLSRVERFGWEKTAKRVYKVIENMAKIS